MTNTPNTSCEFCTECNVVTDELGRCTNTTCFRYRPPDAKPIADPPKPKRLVGADRESPASGGRFPEPPASPVKVNSADTMSRIEEAVQAAAGTVTVDPNVVRNIGGFHRGATLEPSPEPVPPGEKVRENPKHAALRAVLMALDDLPTEDARKVLAAADAQLELN